MERKYLPTLSDLIDRLSIVQLKAIFISENKVAYDSEIELIKHDIDLVLAEKGGWQVSAEDIRSMLILMLANHFIWVNEGKAREGGREQDHLLRITHSVNGIRAKTKNAIARVFDERVDLKTDSLAQDLPVGAGNWDIFK